MTNLFRAALAGALFAMLPNLVFADQARLPNPLPMDLTGTLVLAETAPTPRQGAVQHAMPPGGYVGTLHLTGLMPTPRQGAVQHAMPPGGYVGTLHLTGLAPTPRRGAVQHAMPPGGYVGTEPPLVVIATD